MSDEPGFGPETHGTYEPTAEEVAARARRPVDDALDRLGNGLRATAESLGMAVATQWFADLATVREALERQRDDNGRLVQVMDGMARESDLEHQAERRAYWRKRAEAAEAERDRMRHWAGRAEVAEGKLDSAEAEVRRLTEGLREADEAVSAAHDVLWASYDEWEGEHGHREPLNASMWRLHEILRSLLSASPSDGGGA